MEEQKIPQNILNDTPDTPASTQEDFPHTNISNLKLNDLEVTSAPENLISKVNQEAQKQPSKQDVQRENLGIATQEVQPKTEKIAFGNSGIFSSKKSKYHNQYRRLFLLSFFVIVVSVLASIVLKFYSRYMYLAAQPILDPNYEVYVQTYKQGKGMIDKLLHPARYEEYVSFSLLGSGGDEKVNGVINQSKLNFIQKKDILQNALNEFWQSFVQNTQELNDIKENISKYGFFSQDLYYVLEDNSYTTSIKKYLLSLEIIKFSSAIKVFSYLDTFISSLANALNVSSSVIQTNMESFVKRGEKDILVYLNNCYLNPYEIDYDCNMVGDFDRYYRIIEKDQTTLDKMFFKKMMQYVDTKLEQTELPSFSITFKRYDPTQKQISFTLEVNTFKQDEVALIKKGIINPHIFIVSNLLNLIKQSVFVVSQDISTKSIKIESKVIKIGSAVFNVNNSTLDFTLPIQKSTEREISDYIDPIFTSSP